MELLLVLFVGCGVISRMEYLNAADMKKLADKHNEESADRELAELLERIQHAAEAGLYYVKTDILSLSIAKKFKDMGYEITYNVRGDKETISWRK